MKHLTQSRVLELLRYEDGILYWRHPRRGVSFKRPIGTNRPDGYLGVCIDGKDYLVHRVVWLYFNGVFPIGELDNIDGNRRNNKIGNLRDVSKFVNMQYMRRSKSSKTLGKMLGVNFDKQTGKWRAKIVVAGKSKHLGRFDTEEDAHTAYLSAKRKYHEGCTL